MHGPLQGEPGTADTDVKGPFLWLVFSVVPTLQLGRMLPLLHLLSERCGQPFRAPLHCICSSNARWGRGAGKGCMSPPLCCHLLSVGRSELMGLYSKTFSPLQGEAKKGTLPRAATSVVLVGQGGVTGVQSKGLPPFSPLDRRSRLFLGIIYFYCALWWF